MNKEEITTKKKEIQDSMNVLKTQYGNLDQITMQSGEGNYIYSQIERYKGWIEAFNWILNKF